MKLSEILHDLLMTKYNKDCDGNKYQNDGGVMGRLLHASDFFKPIQDKLLKNYDVSEKEQAIKLLDLFDLVKSKEDNSEICIVNRPSSHKPSKFPTKCLGV